MPYRCRRWVTFHAARLLCRTALLVFGAGCLGATAAAQTIPAPPGFEVLQYGGPARNAYQGSVLVADFDRRIVREGQFDRMDIFLSGLRQPRGLDPAASLSFTEFFLHETSLVRDDPGAPLREVYAFRRNTTPFDELFFSAAAAEDFDNDGDLDLLYLGTTTDGPPFNPVTRLRVNNGDVNARFDAALNGFDDLFFGSADWGDFDNDGFSDLLLTGLTTTGFATRLYRNLGGGAFEAVAAGLDDAGYGAARWGDFDNDGDLDILLTGAAQPQHFISKIYRNDQGRFLETDVALPGLAFSKAAWSDFDGDGRLDVVLTGGFLNPFILQGRTAVFRNLGNERFEEIPVEGQGYFDGHLAVGDYDNDGDPDFLVSGRQRATGRSNAVLFRNDGDRFQLDYFVPETASSAFVLADFDRDDDLDVFITGFDPDASGLAPPQTQFYLNNRGANAPPQPPTGLQAAVQGRAVTFSWNPSSDDRTPAPGLSYNVRVGTTPGGGDVVSPLADAASGRRWVSAPGNAGPNTRRRLTLPPGTYFWSVQALDAAYAASAFAPDEGVFTISAAPEGGTATGVDAPGLPAQVMLAPGYPNPFREQTVIRYALGEAAAVRLAVYDVLGRRLRTLVEGTEPAGQRAVVWDATDAGGARLPGGVYLYRLEVRGGPVLTRTATLVR